MSLIETLLSIFISLLVLFGSFLIFAGVLGIVRFPDVFLPHACFHKGPDSGHHADHAGLDHLLRHCRQS